MSANIQYLDDIPPTTPKANIQYLDDSNTQTGTLPSGSSPLNPLRVGLFIKNQVENTEPWNKVSKVFPYVAGKEAEMYGRMGVPAPISASLTTPLAMAPAIAGAALGLQGIYNAESPVVKGLVNTPAELGPEYEAQNEAIGVTRTTPKEGGQYPTYENPYEYPSQLTKPKYVNGEPIANPGGSAFTRPRPILSGPNANASPLPSEMPVRYPSDPGDFIPYANGRLANAPDSIQPQELMDWQVKLQRDMSNGTIPKFDPRNGHITTIYRDASDLASRAGEQFNKFADPLLENVDLPEGISSTRSGLNKANTIANKQQAITNAIGKGAKWATGLGSSGYVGYDLLKKLLNKTTQ